MITCRLENEYVFCKEELDFLSKSQYKINFEDLIKLKKDNSGNFSPSVWLMINNTTFRESIHIIKLMPRRKRETITGL